MLDESDLLLMPPAQQQQNLPIKIALMGGLRRAIPQLAVLNFTHRFRCYQWFPADELTNCGLALLDEVDQHVLKEQLSLYTVDTNFERTGSYYRNQLIKRAPDFGQRVRYMAVLCTDRSCQRRAPRSSATATHVSA